MLFSCKKKNLKFLKGVTPHLYDGQKLILDHESGYIKFGGMGGASILSSLKKFRVFETWKKEEITFVNIIDTNNFNSKICDPFTFAFLTSTKPKRHIVMDVIRTDGQKPLLENPVVLKKKIRLITVSSLLKFLT